MPPRINIPPVTRALLIALVLQSALSAAIRYRQWSAHTEVVIPYLNLIPQLSLIYPWTFVTTTLVETNLVTFAVAAVTLYNGGRYLERAWSSREFAKFLLISSLVPNFLCFAVMFVFFVFSRNEHWTLSTIGGTIPLQISFLIAFSQLVPAHTVTLFRGIVSLRVPRFPILYVGAITVLSLTPMLTSASFFLAIFGMLTSWTYLRFYKTAFPDLDSSQSASLRGDASETFAFAEFFPGPVKPFVAGLSAQVFGVLVALRLCSPFSQADVAASRGDGGAFLQRGAPSSARAEAERRRAVALKALDQRLHAATAHAASRPSGGSSHQQPPPAAVTATGPTVQSQPQPSAQAAMTSQPPVLLGETNYVPEHESSEQHGP